MTKDVITRIYEDLRQLGSCTSRSSFSVDWLASNEAYFRTTQARREPVSVRAQAHLAASLRNMGMAFVKSEFPQLRDKGAAMLNLYSICADDLFERVVLRSVTTRSES